jgi:asparagine synthase (glutamine-hydrolysing)
MCGIVAVIGPGRPGVEQLKRATHSIEHRGPDDHGSWADGDAWLASRRLAILDQSTKGHQPMVADGVATIVFNGEIYNFIELRDLLRSYGHEFRTGTDTEVALRAYMQWGSSCLSRFNGMWAMVIWDHREKFAFLARDRFGVKPFYYSLVGDRLTVGSEPKAILELEPQLRQADEVTLVRLLAEKQLDLRDRSFYKGIVPLAAGHYALFRPGDRNVVSERYWDIPAVGALGLDATRAADEFAALLDDSVRLRLRSDVPVGMTLSGGLDSTSILEAAVLNDTTGRGFTAFTSVYPEEPEIDEGRWARLAVQRHESVRLVEVDSRPNDWIGVLRKVVWHMDGPGYSPAIFPLWLIMERARESGIPVLLEGQGADELLGGYSIHSAYALLDQFYASRRRPTLHSVRQLYCAARAAAASHGLRRMLNDTALSAVPYARVLQERRVGFREALRADFVSSTAIGDAKTSESHSHNDRLGQRLFDDFTARTLPGFLHYGDAVSMAHSIESRLPFMDYRIVEFCFRLESTLKISCGHTKRVIRDYLHRRGQHAIATRTDKRGYPTPAPHWLAADNGAVLRNLLLDPGARTADFVDRKGLQRLIARHVAGHFAASDQLYALVTAELWLQECIYVSR